ncbi:MerR family transcriptional regulator [Xylophilus sp.]|uniref:MerR family transcriptional regulator n=1 Tax=Xylophilus sp. TaxID=2653893 RepID=UPI002D7FE1E4|nr:helix-turn-helix domain-containing protein [Xylophilus sp.]
MPELNFGELAERTGTNTPTIRYYEGIGLLPRPDRQEGNQRRYGDDAVKRLTFIRRCRDCGFSIEQVRTLTSLMQDRDRSCFEARDLAHGHLKEVQAKLKELRELEKNIASFVESCNVAYGGGPAPYCIILEDVACVKSVAMAQGA